MLVYDLALRHAGRPVVVMGGGPSLPAQLSNCPSDAIYISANQHGVMLRSADYVVALDDLEQVLRPFGLPIVGRRLWCDYRFPEWGNDADSGQAGMLLGSIVGGYPVILTGMDCFQGGTYFHDPEAHSSGNRATLEWHLDRWRKAATRVAAPVRSCGGPTATIFPPWDPSEVFDDYVPAPGQLAMQRIRPHRVRIRPRGMINRRRVQTETECLVSPEEYRQLQRQRALREQS